MEIISIQNEDAIYKAVEAIQDGGIVVYPTETAYGLGANALDKDAVKKLYFLKNRPQEKPTHVIVSDLNIIERYAVVTAFHEKLMHAFWPGPLTIVFQKKSAIYNSPSGSFDFIAIRIPDSNTAYSLTQLSDTPITAPSANKAGDTTPYSIQEVLESFGSQAENIDIIIDAGVLPKRPVSTVVEISDGEVVVHREGAISKEEVLRVLE